MTTISRLKTKKIAAYYSTSNMGSREWARDRKNRPLSYPQSTLAHGGFQSRPFNAHSSLPESGTGKASVKMHSLHMGARHSMNGTEEGPTATTRRCLMKKTKMYAIPTQLTRQALHGQDIGGITHPLTLEAATKAAVLRPMI